MTGIGERISAYLDHRQLCVHSAVRMSKGGPTNSSEWAEGLYSTLSEAFFDGEAIPGTSLAPGELIFDPRKVYAKQDSAGETAILVRRSSWYKSPRRIPLADIQAVVEKQGGVAHTIPKIRSKESIFSRLSLRSSLLRA